VNLRRAFCALVLFIGIFSPISHAAINYWQPLGTVINKAAGFSPGQPTVLYEGNSQLGLGAGNVFKMWYDNVASPYGIYYAESLDGTIWTEDPLNPIIAAVGGGTKVFKNGSTYYLYCGPGNFSGTAISAYTSSDGVTWTLQNATALTPTQTWEGSGVYQLTVCDVVGGTWYGYYSGGSNGTPVYGTGMATSTDGLTWTKPSNPSRVDSMSTGTFLSGAPWTGGGNFTFAKVNGRYYGWSQTTQKNYPNAVLPVYSLPSDIMRWSAPSAAGPWTPTGTLTYYRNASTEGVNSGKGQVADPTILEVAGVTHLFYTAVPDGTAEATTGYINHATASAPLATLVNTYEGVQNIPIPFPGGTKSLNFGLLASDNFTRADANPIGGNWTRFSSSAGFVAAQLLSNSFASSTVNSNPDSFWNAATWPNDQWSQITIKALGTSTDTVLPLLRVNTSGVLTAYRIHWTGKAGTTSASIIDQRLASGTYTDLTDRTPSVVLQIGDAITACVVGAVIDVYLNGYLVSVVVDATPITSGAAGASVDPAAAIANAELSAWAGGNANVIPNYPSSGALFFGSIP
jgi:hypothetical protein